MQKEFTSLDDIYNLTVINIETNPNYALLVTYNNVEAIKYSLEKILKIN